jgi:ribose 5-phosphate isomerase A
LCISPKYDAKAGSTLSLSQSESWKQAAAERALAFVKPGMKLGLGTGSTARHFVDLLGAAVANGLTIVGVPTSEQTLAQARSLGVPVTTLEETPELDLTIDGADEIDPGLRLIKGGGGALLREKIVAAASRRMVVIVDSSKLVKGLGAFPLPVEVAPFGYGATRRHIERLGRDLGLGGAIGLRKSGDGLFVTDGGHYIFDCAFLSIPDPEALARGLSAIPGVVEHGLFLGMASTAIIAGAEGIEIIGEPAESV